MSSGACHDAAGGIRPELVLAWDATRTGGFRFPRDGKDAGLPTFDLPATWELEHGGSSCEFHFASVSCLAGQGDNSGWTSHDLRLQAA